MQALGQFGELSEEILDSAKYAAVMAAYINKAVREGIPITPPQQDTVT